MLVIRVDRRQRPQMLVCWHESWLSSDVLNFTKNIRQRGRCGHALKRVVIKRKPNGGRRAGSLSPRKGGRALKSRKALTQLAEDLTQLRLADWLVANA